MKISTILIFSFLVLLSCEDKQIEPTNFQGNWKLSEVLADPGDGSGTFQPVDNDDTILLFENLTFTTNFNLCSQMSQSQAKSGEYDTTNMVFIVDDCNLSNGSKTKYSFELNDLNQLILYYPMCIEPCASKFIKISE
jgi:hypothetical protein